MEVQLVSHNDNEAIIFDNQELMSINSYWNEQKFKDAIPIRIVLPNPSEEINKKNISVSEVKNADINKPPFNSGGKLFFTQGGVNYVGSAEFCESKNLILTAAHCVRDMETGAWSENIVFKRGYNGSSFKQEFSIRAVALKGYWCSQKNYRWDYAFCITDTSSDVKELSSKINVYSGETIAFGYPTNYSDGKKMQCVEAEIDGEPKVSCIVRMEGNTMGGGCSGGAWINKETGTVISLNSFSYIGDDTTEYGPIFTEEYSSLVEYAKTLI